MRMFILLLFVSFTSFGVKSNILVVDSPTIDVTNSIYVMPVIVDINGIVHKEDKNISFLKDGNVKFHLVDLEKKHFEIIRYIISNEKNIDYIKFSCRSVMDKKICNSFEYLEFEFSLPLGTIRLFYKNRTTEENLYLANSSPLLLLHNDLNVIYNGSTSKNSFSGLYNLEMTYGISEESNIKLDSKLVFNQDENYHNLEGIRYDNTSSDFGWGMFFGDSNSRNFRRLKKKSFLGIDIYKKEEQIIKNDETNNVLMVNSNYIGVFKVYDEFKNILSISRANLGLNRVIIDSDFNGGKVFVETIVNDEVVNTSEEYIFYGKKKSLDFYYNVKVGSFDYQGDKDEDWEKIVYSELDLGGKNYSINAGWAPKAKSWDLTFTTSLLNFDSKFDYGKNEGFNFSLSRVFHIEQIDTVFTGNYQYIGSSRLDKASISFSKNVNNNDSFSLTYMIDNLDTPFLSNNMVANYFTNRKYENYEAIYSIDVSTDFKQRHTVGVNLELKFDGNNWFSPSVNIGYSSFGLSTRVSNSAEYDESRIKAGLSFINDNVNALDLNFSSSNDSFISNGVFFYSRESNYFSYRLSNYVGISKYGVVNNANNFENAIKVNDELLASNNKVKYNLNLENVKFPVEDNKIISLGGRWSDRVIELDTGSRSIVLDSDSSRFQTGKYRIYPIKIDFDLESLMVSGRVFLNDEPIEGVYVKNHNGESYTGKFGYFKLKVSREEPKIDLSLDNAICNSIDLKEHKYDLTQTDIYIGRIICKEY